MEKWQELAARQALEGAKVRGYYIRDLFLPGDAINEWLAICQEQDRAVVVVEVGTAGSVVVWSEELRGRALDTFSAAAVGLGAQVGSASLMVWVESFAAACELASLRARLASEAHEAHERTGESSEESKA